MDTMIKEYEECHNPKIVVVGCGIGSVDMIAHIFQNDVWGEQIVFLPIQKQDTSNMVLKNVDLVINVSCSDEMDIATMVAKEARKNGALVVSVVIKSPDIKVDDLLQNRDEKDVFFCD